MLREIFVAMVWIIANFAYGSMARSGEQGFRRLAAFWLGWPGTFVSYSVIQPTRRLTEPETDTRYALQLELEAERDLLVEIRRDRARRLSQSPAADEGPDVAGDQRV